MPVTQITSSDQFYQKIREGPVVLDCFATWCGPSKAIAPKFEEFSQTYPQAKFYRIDVDELSDVAEEFGVRAMPTFVFFKNGEKVQDVVGANPSALKTAIESLIADI